MVEHLKLWCVGRLYVHVHGHSSMPNNVPRHQVLADLDLMAALSRKNERPPV